jgi:hypothetical protein
MFEALQCADPPKKQAGHHGLFMMQRIVNISRVTIKVSPESINCDECQWHWQKDNTK